MAYLIGTDEAGYGPYLGPLVISASVWEVPGQPQRVDLYERLADVVCRSPLRGRAPSGEPCPTNPVAIADSKLLYRPPQGLALLERGVMAALGLLGECPRDWRSLWNALEPQPAAPCEHLPWHVGFSLDLPLDADADELATMAPWFRAGVKKAGLRLIALRSRTVFPQQFNELTLLYGSKGEALSRLTLGLVADLLASLEPAATLVVCDKHGGRNRYGPLLQPLFPDQLVEVRGEGREESIYRWGPPRRRTEFRFRAGGEDMLPTALASMASKYLRELAMQAFNSFWCGRVPDLRPTAGYPTDAHRFKAAIEAAQVELGIGDDLLWRVR